MNKVKFLSRCILIIGAGVDAVDGWRPVNGTVSESWGNVTSPPQSVISIASK